MTIKIRKKGQTQDTVRYKSSKRILTPQDIKEADKFDFDLNENIKEIEVLLVKSKVLSGVNNKTDSLKAWYIIGRHINKFLKSHRLASDDENLFWEYLYGRSPLINKKIPSTKISKTRNDFKMATLLAHYPFKKIKKIGPWALWREILAYGVFMRDERILNLVLQRLEEFPPKTRNEARPFLMAVATRLKKIDTTTLTNEEILGKLASTKFKLKNI